MKPEQFTAWALQELSAEEQAQVDTLLQEDAKAQQQAKQTKDFCDFLLTELHDDSLALSEEQRSQALAGAESLAKPPVQSAGPTKSSVNQAKQPRRYMLPLLAAAAAVALLATVPWVTEHEMPQKDLRPAELAAGSVSDDAGQIRIQGRNAYSGGTTVPQPKPVAEPLKKEAPVLAGQSQMASSSLKNGSGEMAANYADVLRMDPVNSAARRPEEGSPAVGLLAAAPSSPPLPPGVIRRVDISGPPSGNFDEVIRREMPGDMPLTTVLIPANKESYTRILENELQDAVRAPLSTFSIDVDTAAYANVRRFLNQNSLPPRDAVRVEELINYFPTTEEGPASNAKEPFAVRVQMAACPWQPQHRLARVAIKGKDIGNDRKASNLVFLVDVSGSMNEPGKLPLVQQSLRILTERLGENDHVSMVTYAGNSGVVLASTSGQKKAEILAAIDRLSAGGSTHGSAGIESAYEQAVAGFIQGGVNRVILCTDGDFNVGVSSPEELERVITEKARSGVFLSVLGYGTGNLKDRTMETLADKGNGNYAYIDSMGEARKVLVEQLSGTLVTIAKDVKIQVEFNPALVRSYRLLGYENRLLAKEDFNDDTKDAGEIGAGHCVTALYEIVPANLPAGSETRPLVDKLKYGRQLDAPALAAPSPTAVAASAGANEVMTVKLRYKQPDGDVSQLIEVPVKDNGRAFSGAEPEFKFSAAVAGFGMLLRGSGYRGQLTWEQVRQLALEGKGPDAMGYRGEFIQLIEKARGMKR